MDSYIRCSPVRVRSNLLGGVCSFPFGVQLRVTRFRVKVFFAGFDRVLFGYGTSVCEEFALTRGVGVKAVGGLCPRGAVLLFLVPLSSEAVFRNTGMRGEGRVEKGGGGRK